VARAAFALGAAETGRVAPPSPLTELGAAAEPLELPFEPASLPAGLPYVVGRIDPETEARPLVGPAVGTALTGLALEGTALTGADARPLVGPPAAAAPAGAALAEAALAGAALAGTALTGAEARPLAGAVLA
jgi:hypothetical protein